MHTITSFDDLTPLIGQHLGTSDGLVITQERIDTFAAATDDHQWIHVDTERATSGPYGGTIAHFGVNYGLNKVRFPSPVPVGSTVRLGAVLSAAEALGDGGVQATLQLTYEIEGGTKPACVAELVLRYFFHQ